MDALTGAKLWLLIKPIQRIKQALNPRRIRKGKEPFNIGSEDEEMAAILGPISKLIGGLVGEIVAKVLLMFPVLEQIVVAMGGTPDGVAEKVAAFVVNLLFVGAGIYFAPKNT